MIDGITINYKLENFGEWRRSVNIDFETNINIDGGEIKTKKRNEDIITVHRGNWETFVLIVKEVKNIATGKIIFYLKIKGSLHKNHYGGKNYLPFSWHHLQQQINHICNSLSIDATAAQISSLEAGVNIITPYTVTPFLRQNIISYKGNSFNRYKKDATGFCLGIYCTLSQYVIKIYDKGLQNELPYNLMRFEKRFLKMQIINRMGIRFLSDLLSFAKFEKLLPQLLDAWQNVLIYDIEKLQKTAKNYKDLQRENELLINGQNPKYWENLKDDNKRQFNYQRKKFKNIVAKFGNNWHQLVKGLIQNEWQELCKNCTDLPIGKSDSLHNLTIKIKGKNEQCLKPGTEFCESIKKRQCQTCGKDITNQKGGSKFCSAKYVGYEAAHQCRNNSSNPRNNFNRKIEIIQRRGILFDIRPYLKPPENVQWNYKTL